MSNREGELQATISRLESDKTMLNWHLVRNRVLQEEYDRLLIVLALRDERIEQQQATITMLGDMLKNASR
jgi:hypothetical protein